MHTRYSNENNQKDEKKYVEQKVNQLKKTEFMCPQICHVQTKMSTDFCSSLLTDV